MFQNLNLSSNDEVQIGTGNNPSAIQSIITTIQGSLNNAPDDVYLDTNEMWIAVIGSNSKSDTGLRMGVEIISLDLSSECVIITDLS